MKVHVIGRGPAGILAAYAALQNNCQVSVWYPPGTGKSVIHGAQYIHSAPTGLLRSIEPFQIKYRKFGTEERYRQKIYGEEVPPGGTSWDMFRVVEWAWPMDQVYDYLYKVVEMNADMLAMKVDQESIKAMVATADYVLNTAPLKAIAPDGEYRQEEVFVLDRGSYGVKANEIWYLGDFKSAYRTSLIADHGSTEYPKLKDVPFQYRRKAVRVVKPLDCAVELPGVCRLGRYGKWKKGVLAHHAYDEAFRILKKRLSWTATLQD